jgi:hypothetical protein
MLLKIRRGGLIGLLVLFAAVLASCAPLPPAPPGPPPIAEVPAELPTGYYLESEALGKTVLRVDPARSLVVIEVRRAGALAHLGHDHVVAGHDLRGYVAPQDRRADLFVRLDRLVVDEPDLRAEAGFDTQPSPDAIAGTRTNMLDRVLEAERFPFALIDVTQDVPKEVPLGGAPKEVPPPLRIAITLHGTTRDFLVPAQVENLPDGIAIGGRLHFKQTDFGIVPMSVFGGALQVRDELDLRFRVVARR